MNESRCTFLPETEATKPTKGQFFRRVVDSWWVVHPEKGLVFYGKHFRSPQCNLNEAITRKLSDGMYEFPHEVKFIELAWVPVDLNDYR